MTPTQVMDEATVGGLDDLARAAVALDATT